MAREPGQVVDSDALLSKYLDEAFAFLNGGLYDTRLVHFCPVGCCASREEACEKCYVVLNNLLLALGIPLFTSVRWLKQTPALRWWARGLCLHNIVGSVFKRMLFSEEVQRNDNLFAHDKGRGRGKGKAGKGHGRGRGKGRGGKAAHGAPQGPALAPTQTELGKRLGKSREFFQRPLARFHVITTLHYVTVLDSLAYVLFHVSDCQERGGASSFRYTPFNPPPPNIACTPLNESRNESTSKGQLWWTPLASVRIQQRSNYRNRLQTWY